MWGVPKWEMWRSDFHLVLKCTTFHSKGRGGAIDSFHVSLLLFSAFSLNSTHIIQLQIIFFMRRTYVLVTSMSPLRAYFYHEGLVRFASSKYNHSEASKGNETQILTNTSIGMSHNTVRWFLWCHPIVILETSNIISSTLSTIPFSIWISIDYWQKNFLKFCRFWINAKVFFAGSVHVSVGMRERRNPSHAPLRLMLRPFMKIFVVKVFSYTVAYEYIISYSFCMEYTIV